ncbi:MAG: porin family protein [Candidatus Saccharicenans sp.]
MVRKSLYLGLAIFAFLLLTKEAQAISFGFKGGYNLVNFTVKPTNPGTPQLKNSQTLSGGLYLAFRLGPFSLQPEFLYTRRGTRFNFYDDSVKYQAEYWLEYLEGVLLLKWKIITLGPANPFILAGPSFGYLSQASIAVFDESGAKVISADTMDYFKKTELAAVFGAGVGFKLSVVKISIECRYHLGLSNVARMSGPEMEAESIKNKSYSLLISIGF